MKLKTIDKILITITLAVAAWLVSEAIQGPSQSDPATTTANKFEVLKPRLTEKDLQRVYREYNEQYFNGRLIKDITIGYEEYNNEYLSTTVRALGDEDRFTIQLNVEYTKADRVARYAMLHEMCHVSTWSEAYPDKNQVFYDKTKLHGPRWRACMLQIDQMGGFRDIFID